MKIFTPRGSLFTRSLTERKRPTDLSSPCDGSQDDTALIAEKFGAMVVRSKRNFGKGAALRTCFDWAKRANADVLVTLDADGFTDSRAHSHLPLALMTLRGLVGANVRLLVSRRFYYVPFDFTACRA
jgi:lysophospholipid acyltransferase (LPLAT)-like uncharacterized protein